MSTGTEVDLWQQAYEQLSPEARDRFAIEQVKTIRNTVAENLTPAEFQMGLAIAAKYDLDPLLKEIWFAKGKPRDGRPGRLLMMVGRDGLLRNARRKPDYAGFDADVVRENDSFEVERLDNGERKIRHKYSGGTKERGKILGAWAQVYQRGKSTTYFYAPWDEYAPTTLKDGDSWKKTPSVMIQKCALSLCLRLAFNLSGLVGEEEAARVFEDEAAEAPSVPSGTTLDQTIGLVDEDLRYDFREAWLAAWQTKPGVYSPAAVQMRIGGQPREVVEELIREMRAVVETAGPGPEIPDAEVVAPDDATDPTLDVDDPRSIGEITQDETDSIDNAEEVEALRAKLSGLYDRQTAVEENPGDEAETRAELDAIGQEIDEVEGKLRAAGGDVPGQETLL